MEDSDMAIVTNDPIATSWHRYFRRTSVYIAEYILMLVVVGSLVGVLSTLLYSFFNLIQSDGYVAQALAVATIAQLASLVVLAPAAFWLHARVSGQEVVDPTRRSSTARTVFLSIWLIGMMLSIVGVSISVVIGLLGGVISTGDTSIGELIIRAVIPGTLVIVLLATTVILVVRRVSRKSTIRTGIGIAALVAVLFISNLVLAIVKKDAGTDRDESCTYSRYIDKECSYSEYREYRRDSSNVEYNRGSGSGGFENIYQPSYR